MDVDRLRETALAAYTARGVREIDAPRREVWAAAVASDGGGVAGNEWFAARERLRADLLILAEEGILLRDAETGLVDFPAERDGRPVFLCWRLGEDRVAWYHEERAGFANRRPL